MSDPSLPFSAGSIFRGLMENACLLIALAYIHSLLPVTRRRPTVVRQLVPGFLLGLIGVMVITAAYPFRGAIFDTRSILIGITGLYFGVIPTAVVMAVTGAYRLWQGGGAAPIGLAVIFASGLTGLAWRHFRKPDLARIRWRELLGFGVTVHVVMLAIFLTFPADDLAEVFAVMTLPVLGIYPVVTAVLGRLLSARLQRVEDGERLRESDERFKLIFKGANDGWWDWDLVTDRITFSPRGWEMLGMEPDGRTVAPAAVRELVHPDDRTRAEERFAEALRSGGEPYEIEVRLRHAAGHYISVISRGHISRDQEGRAVRVSGTNMDITAMRRALDETRAAKSLLESAGRIGRIGYWEISFVDNSLFWSDITAEIHDLPPGTQISLEQAMTFFSEEYHGRIARDGEGVRTLGRAFENEYEIVTAKGRRVWVQARGEPVRAEDRRIVGMRGVLQDIDHRKRAAEALHRSERNYREIFNGTTDAIFIHDDSTGRILDVNEAMLRMYRFAEKPAALASSIAAVSSGEEGFTAADARENTRIAMTEGSHTFPWHARRADGTTFWVEVSLRRTEIGGKGRILASVRDISERRALEERVREAEKMESVGRLAGGISHDFNNMLAVITGHAELASYRLGTGGDVSGDLVQIRHAAERSANLVRQLLTFARRQVIAPRLIDLNESVDGVLAMIRRLIGRNIGLEWKPSERLWPVMMDPVQMDQILTNLVLNARDSILDAGVISIRTANCEERDQVVLEVADTGAGMGPETLKHVFEPFFTTKGTGRGTGLGLATVYGIVEQNGGTIEVASEPGAGTTFTIRLPRQISSAVPQAADEGDPTETSGNESILLVEDEPAILRLAAEALGIRGYHVLPAATPAEAVEIVSRADEAIDLVVSDMIMPGMNGRALRAEILAIRPGLRFLFISGYTEGLEEEIAGVPPVDFLAKPFSADCLCGKVRQILASGGSMENQFRLTR